MIDGVKIIPLRIFPDERGPVMHMLRADAPHFLQFGEVYFSGVSPGAIKGWRRHKRSTSNLAVPMGRVRIVMFDDRAESPTFNEVQEVEIGPDAAYALISIPPGVWNAFQGLSAEMSLVTNCATLVHEPGEAETRPLDDPPVAFNW